MLITEVDPGSPAFKGGVLVKDVFYSVDDVRVSSVEDIAARLAGKREVRVVVVNEQGGVEAVILRPVNGRIGIGGEPITLE